MTQKQIKDEYKLDTSNLVEAIIKNYQPQKIIAFGSTASGRINEDSDIDLLIIKETEKPFWQRVKEVLRLYNGFRSLDVSVLTPEEAETAEKRGWFFIKDQMIDKGKILYERN